MLSYHWLLLLSDKTIVFVSPQPRASHRFVLFAGLGHQVEPKVQPGMADCLSERPAWILLSYRKFPCRYMEYLSIRAKGGIGGLYLLAQASLCVVRSILNLGRYSECLSNIGLPSLCLAAVSDLQSDTYKYRDLQSR